VAEIPGGEWHSVIFQAPAAVVLEVKAGPYQPQLDKEFASWAPAENDPAAARELARDPGLLYPAMTSTRRGDISRRGHHA
jgi:hypothetical protein